MGEPEDDILVLIERGRKIEAIKLARESLGMSLAEAKDFVEGLEKGERANADTPPRRPGHEADHEIDRLLREKRKIDAVRVYREQAGCGLKEAKDAIEQRAVALGLQSRPSKCFIATAACGGGEQQSVMVLRRYRNRVLKKSAGGRLAVGVYELLSPPAAWVVGKNETAAAVVRWVIGRLVRSRRLQETTRPPRP